MKHALLIFVATLACFVPAFAEVPFIHSEGVLTMSFAGVSPEVTLQTKLEFGWQDDRGRASLVAEFEHGVWKSLSLVGNLAVGTTTLEGECGFDPAGPSFSFATAKATWEWAGGRMEGLARLEEGGWGWGFSLQSEQGLFLQSLRLRFNLKRYRDELEDPAFALRFSSASLSFSLPLPCCKQGILGEAWLDKTGLEEVRLQLQPPYQVVSWLAFGATVVFRPDGKEAALTPSLELESPECFDLYWGIDWDRDTGAFQGLKLYGLGFRATTGGVEIRSLTSLSPDEFPLVKSPYWELFGIVWKLSGCCGEGEASAVFYFGDSGPFGISELDVEIRLSPNRTCHLSFTLALSSAPTLELGWSDTL